MATTKKKTTARKTRASRTVARAGSENVPVRDKQELDAGGEPEERGKWYVPLADIFETGDALLVVLETPGVSKDGVEVHLDDGVLSVEGRVDFSKYENLRPVYSEYNVGNFARRFRISQDVDPDHIRATLDNGVLTLELAKRKRQASRRIPIDG